VELAETAIARERLCKQTPVARQWLGHRHMIAATSQPGTMEELLEAVFSLWSAPFSMWSVPSLCNEKLQDSLELVVRESAVCSESMRLV
jgi:hypothetical protein